MNKKPKHLFRLRAGKPKPDLFALWPMSEHNRQTICNLTNPQLSPSDFETRLNNGEQVSTTLGSIFYLK